MSKLPAPLLRAALSAQKAAQMLKPWLRRTCMLWGAFALSEVSGRALHMQNRTVSGRSNVLATIELLKWKFSPASGVSEKLMC